MWRNAVIGSLLMWALIAVAASQVHAASLKVCYDPASANSDVSTVNVLNTALTPPSVLASAPAAPVTGCFTVPFPASLVRGTNTPVAVQFANALGEVGPNSNVVAFRAPLIPGTPGAVTVSAVAP